MVRTKLQSKASEKLEGQRHKKKRQNRKKKQQQILTHGGGSNNALNLAMVHGKRKGKKKDYADILWNSAKKSAASLALG